MKTFEHFLSNINKNNNSNILKEFSDFLISENVIKPWMNSGIVLSNYKINESFNTKDLVSILTKYTKFLKDNELLYTDVFYKQYNGDFGSLINKFFDKTESYNVMSLTVPDESEWNKVDVNGEDHYAINYMDRDYIVRKSKEEWLKDNIGKNIKFKYDKSAKPVFIEMPEVMNEKLDTKQAKELIEYIYKNGEHKLVQTYKGKISDSDISSIINYYATSKYEPINIAVNNFMQLHNKLYKNTNENNLKFGFGNYTFGYDLINGIFLNKKEFNKVNDINNIEIIIINVYEPSAYHYKWTINYKGNTIENSSGSIQAFVLNIKNVILKLNGKSLSYKEEDKLYNLYNFFNMNESMGDVKWASDGGYYTKPDRSIIVSKEDANFINNTIEEFKRNILNSKTPILVDKTEKGKINMEIINDLKKHWNINFENDSEEGIDYFWLLSNQNTEDIKDALENAWQLFYDKIEKNYNEKRT